MEVGAKCRKKIPFGANASALMSSSVHTQLHQYTLLFKSMGIYDKNVYFYLARMS